MIRINENTDYVENQDPSDHSSFSVIDPNSNHLVDSDNEPVPDDEIMEINNILFACDNIPASIMKDNVTVISNRVIAGVRTLSDDVRYSSKIDRFDKIIINKALRSSEDYKILIKNFERKASNDSELIIMSSKHDLSVRKFALDLGLYFKQNEDYSSVSRTEDKFKYYSIGENLFKTLMCNTPEEKNRGLQAVDFLEDDEAMCFLYDTEMPLTFQMKDVSFPIDILFITNGVVSKICENVKPGDQKFYGGMADLVIEVNGGTCKDKDISEGDECFAVEKEDRDISKFSKIDAYYLSDLIDVDKTTIVSSSVKSIIKGSSCFSERINHLSGSRNFFSKKASYFEPISDNFVLINDSDLNSINTKIAFNKAYPGCSYKIVNSKSRRISEVSNIICSALACHEINIFDFSIEKEAAFPVSNSAKEKALTVDKEVVKNIKRIRDMVASLEYNRNIYEKHKSNYTAVLSSEGVYRQSMRRQLKKFKAVLYSVNSTIKLLVGIKDTTHVEDIMGSMLATTRNLSKFFKEILSLQGKMDSKNFYNDLSQKTDDFCKISEDLETVLRRCRSFIWEHILGKPLLTD